MEISVTQYDLSQQNTWNQHESALEGSQKGVIEWYTLVLP